MGQNYFNTLPLRLQLEELGKCRFMDEHEFADGVDKLKGKKIVIVGCGAQGLHQGLNLRDSGLDVAYTLRCGFWLAALSLSITYVWRSLICVFLSV